jgi:hypothetical protein
VEIDPEAYLIFDDTVLAKSFGPKIEVVRKWCSGNKKGRDPWRGGGLVHLREPENRAFTLGCQVHKDRRGTAAVDQAGACAIQTRSIAHDRDGSVRTS